jgi:hypothetical protein
MSEVPAAMPLTAVLDVRFTGLIQENQRIHRLLVDGVPAECQRGGGGDHPRPGEAGR